MLRAIEEEHFDQLPGGVFNRGFIRAYAKHLGLNSEDAVNEYLACLRQAQVDSHAAWVAAQSGQPRGSIPAKGTAGAPANGSSKLPAPIEIAELPELQLPRPEHIRRAKKEYLGRPSSPVPWLGIALIVCVVMSGFFVWTRHSRNIRAAQAMSSSATAPQQPAATTAESPSQGATTPSSAPPVVASASPRPSTESAQAPPEAPPAAPPDTDRATPARPEPTTNADLNEMKVENKGDVTITSFGAAAARPAEKPAATLTLVVRASENSWISVTVDGQLVTQETLIAPAATSFHAVRELVVRVGNAAGVSFLWNGEELSSQGAEAEAKTFIFDAQGMRAAASTQPAPQD